MKKLMGGSFDEGCTSEDMANCVESTCKEKSTATKACHCNTTLDKCLCCTAS